ncbi:hypothetical protein [Umezawaea sp. Da 62-37]|uniref:hypothetical protein n=1 Tax=Umezawaea sp. Da 62-37 TaxID=3075927 RepID=UPI0028F6C8F2|nr:hypothetical protein [Umezawaea sp. Da 62-37]WNV90801.1 hypothetical protein RM788_21730 [Umezawaea sp. Da 62-37]
MQRPTTTGRRHNRAGSITVAELIRNQPSPVRIPSHEEVDTEGLVEDVLGLEETDPRRSNRAAKAAGLVAGGLVLFASVAAASILAGHRPESTEALRTAAAIELSGSTALRPDLLSAKLGDEPAATPADGASATAAPNTPNAPIAADPSTDAPAPPVDGVVAPPSASIGPQPRIEVVREFYGLLPAQPAAAARLLSTDLVGSDALGFVRSWSTIKAITIDSTTQRPDGSVLADVSMQELDGRWLRVEQLFWFGDMSAPKIIGTELLSAQRS